MTVIFSNRQDDDSILLQRIWQGIDNVNVIEITPSSVDWEDDVDNALIVEDDTLILVGHGSPNGLYYPMYETGEYIIHQNNVGLIHARRVICIWCYASSFCADNHLNCFCSSMFISNPYEALDNLGVIVGQDEINNIDTRIYGELTYSPS